LYRGCQLFQITGLRNQHNQTALSTGITELLPGSVEFCPGLSDNLVEEFRQEIERLEKGTPDHQSASTIEWREAEHREQII